MPSKALMFAQMADDTATEITGSYQKWTAFLTTAARLYKYPFHEQLMIFAQRPEATACAEYDLWNEKMGRYIRRGSKGIALVDTRGERPRLRYVFDVADTGGRENSRRPYLWDYKAEHFETVSDALERRFGVGSEGDLAGQLGAIASRLANDYWQEHSRDILDSIDGSFLEEYDDFNVGAAFRNAAAVSTAYALMSRCGLSPQDYFEHEDFLSIFDFNTPSTVAALGSAVSQSSQEVLRQIGVAIRHYEYERSMENGRADISENRGLSDPKPDLGEAGGTAQREVLEDASGLSEGASPRAVEQADPERESVLPSEGDRGSGEPALGAADAGAGESGGRDGEPESERSDEVGRADERLQGTGGGSDLDGAYFQLTLNLFPAEQEQVAAIDEGREVFFEAPAAPEVEKAVEAVTEPEQSAPTLRREITQDDIDDALRAWNGSIESKHAVIRYMEKHGREKDTAAWLSREYGGNDPKTPLRIALTGSDAETVLPWAKVQRRIFQLIKEDRFYTDAERDNLDDIDPVAIRENLAERGIVGGKLVDPEAQERDPFIRQVISDVEKASAEEAAAEKVPTVREIYDRYLPVVRDLVMADAPYKNACLNSDQENAYIEGAAAIQRAVLSVEAPEFMRLYYDNTEFHNRLHEAVLSETYPLLSQEQEQARFEVTVTSDAFPDPEDAFAIWDNQADDYFIDRDGTVRTFPTEEQAVAFLGTLESQQERMETVASEGDLTSEEGANAPDLEAEKAAEGSLPSPEALRYNVGDTVYLDDTAFEITNIGLFDVELRDPSLYYLVFRAESKERFEQLLRLDERNATFFAAEEKEPEKAASAADNPAYKIGVRVYLDDKPYEITQKDEWAVGLMDRSVKNPALRRVSWDDFERLLKLDSRNMAVTQFFAVNLDITDPDLQEVLTGDGGLLSVRDKENISTMFREGRGNHEIASLLSEYFAGAIGTMELLSGETADFSASTVSLGINVLDKYDTKLSFTWDEVAPVLRAMYEEERDGFSQEPVFYEPVSIEGIPAYKVGDEVVFPYHGMDVKGTIGYVGDLQVRVDTGPYAWSNVTINREYFEQYLRQDERNVHLFTPEVPDTPKPEFTSETVAVYPGEENHLPYDVVIERLHIDEPEKTPPEPTRPENFRISDDHLGEGGAKTKFRRNMDAINLLKELEFDGRQATPEEQKVLSQYVGWGGLADAFDESKENWADEFKELYAALSPGEYAAARSSTLNAHYTSPTVIKAIYEAVGNMGFTTGNILEPSMGVGNFFGLLPEEMQKSKLYGVELDSITGRIAKQLYPNADITVAGFETTNRRDFYDLAVGNVPFGQYQVNDRAYNKLGFSIHDYFFAKTLDQVRPGGVVAFVTSRYTMDKQSPEVRKYIAERAELLGAIRLPNNAFRANAGTDVVSDIIFLQKRDHPIAIEPDWVHLSRNKDGFAINSYFTEHPEMVLGRETSESTQYGRQDFTVVPIEGADLAELLHEAVQRIGGKYQEAELPDFGEDEDTRETIPADPDVKNFSFTVVDGEVYYRENSIMVKPELNATAKERVKGLVELRNIVSELINLQMDEFTSDAEVRLKQAELNERYDDFSAKFGLINDRSNRLAFSSDSSYYLLCSLEVIDENGKLERKADMFSKRTIRQHRSVESVDTAVEALAVSIGERARVDLPYMASLCGKTVEEVTEDLRGVIFKDPAYGSDPLQGWKPADEYLSGNVRQKLRTARRAAENDPQYEVNVAALEKAQPKDLDASEIEVRLGATWIDKKYIQQFMEETFDTPYYLRGRIQVNYSPYTAEWQITGKTAVGSRDVAAYTTFGTDRANAYRLLEDALNLRDIRIYDTVEDPDGKERRVLNAKETTLAAQKQQAIKDAFKDWIWRDPERRQTLVQQYNEEMNSTRPREYDGSHITFAGMNPEITLREHQRNAIAHVLYGGNTLLAHEVGAGKTFEMVASAMESKRLGLCNKSMFVVPNHLTEQWASEFLRLYPSANILVTTKKDFETHNRKKFCARIATGDYDAVIIGHSQFEKIPISAERQARQIQEQIDDITEGIRELKYSTDDRFSVKQLEKTKKSLEARLEKLLADDRKDDVVTFEQLGVDRLFVDESDNYKNLFLYTKMRNVAGLSTTDAQKSSDMFGKCRYMDEITGGRGVVFATGTPISNSMTELYTIQRYLQYDRLQQMGMGHFDCWASRFGETTTALELAPEGTGYRARTRFAKFFNLPELMNMFKEVADIKTADQLHLPTPEVEYHTYASKPTEIQQDMVKALSERATKVHGGSVDPRKDNMLKITSDGRKLGLDQRVINPMLPDEDGTKVNQCVQNVLKFWREGESDKLTQLVFCDISTPRGRSAASGKLAAKNEGGELDAPAPEEAAADDFTIYDDIRQKLIEGGMPKEQIAFIHDADTEVRKKELFGKVRSGQVRVLLGSTAKMGAGTNVQDRLIALHDLDCPWRPRDLTQRKGRIERQGNKNEKVHVCRYVTEGTFDAYLWQTVENKQKFISQIMTSKSPVRSCDDVDEAALSFAEIKALCAGDPRIKERMDLDVDVSRLKIMKADHQSKQFRLEDNLLKYFPEQIEQNRGFVKGLEADMKTLAEHPLPKEGFVGIEIRGDVLTDKENAGAALLDACKEVKSRDAVQIGHYRGFAMSVSFDAFENKHILSLKGEMTHRVELGTDAKGNLLRIENVLDKMPDRLASVNAQLENLYNQKEAARAELGKPFPFEQELAEKTARLVELDTALNLDGRGQAQPEHVAAKQKPSILQKLKAAPVQGEQKKQHTKEMEAR